jgi:DNA-binding response OmpR family regulator
MEDIRGKILLIDDDPAILRVLGNAFREFGYAVQTAGDGIEGVRVFLDTTPEVVISDLIMPRLGGVSTCMEITRLAGENPPVIVMLTSMFHGAPHEHEVPEMGASVHIPKATNPIDIVILVEQLLERNRARQAFIG